MSSTSRQNNLILNEDWTRIYQTFKNADFKSYDFENLRRVIISYLRENYPEDFNDYIESSEYLALIDAVAFLGQSLSFRIDLASRENFIELAERKESVLRIAKMLSYNAKRNIPAQGILKFTSISTTEDVIDGNGRNLANQVIQWNDATNSNWSEQFLLILNSAMADSTEFGRSQGSDIIQGIPTEQYRFRTVSTDVPVYAYNKVVAGRNMAFELVSTSFKDAEDLYEESPYPGNQLGFIYRQDGKGPASANTGFFLMFKQGSLELADFNIAIPTTNETVAVENDNINNNDVWLYKLNSVGSQIAEWTKVEALTGNNIAYNSLVGNVKDIYAIETKENDRINLVFADGVYGNLPQGNFRVYYRVSNGLEYSIPPNEMRGINVSFDYFNKQGIRHTLTVGLGLQYTVDTATASEDIDSIRSNAPANYYTQNRMITGEDYNLAPLTSSQNVLKVKSVNRSSSGISRNFDIIDASGKYSDISVFADDGYLYKETGERTKTFKFTTRIDIINFIRNSIEPVFTDTDVYNFYFTQYPKIIFTDANTRWNSVTSANGSSTGYFFSNVDQGLLQVGSFSTNNLKYIAAGANIKFIAPEGQSFKRNQLVTTDVNDSEQKSYLWTRVVSVTGDGTNVGRGMLSTGLGPVVFSDVIPTGSIATRILPRFINDLPTSLESEIVNLVFQNQNFGLRYDNELAQWVIIQNSNLDLTSAFSLGRAGDITNSALDSSWIIAFVKEFDRYVIRIRTLDYVFGSVQKNRFYFDVNDASYNDQISRVVKDKVKVLGINSSADLINPLKQDIDFEITDTIKFDDGYESSREIKLSFADSDSDGVIDDPDSFEQIVGEDVDLSFLFFQEITDEYGTRVYQLIDNSNDTIKVLESENQFDFADTVNYPDGQLVYFYDVDEDRVKRVNRTTNTLDLESSYKAERGRRNLKFQYIHNAREDRRIDPSVSNIIDVYLLTRSYDTAYRNFLKGAASEPDIPTTDALRIEFGSNLNAIKSISDEIIYHPVKYKVLFGSNADDDLRAVFRVVKNPSKTVNDNDLKVRILNAINEFFDISNWDFGDRFYLSELNTYIFNSVTPDVSNFTIVPVQPDQSFGTLFEIQSGPDEIFISGATVDDIEIVTSINSIETRL